MLNLISYSRHPEDEPVLQQLEPHLQCLSFDMKAAIAIVAFYEATEPEVISFDLPLPALIQLQQVSCLAWAVI